MRSSILLFIFLFLGLSISAQSDTINAAQERGGPNYKRWKTGYIVTLQGDTVHGKIRVTDFLDQYYDFQSKVSFENDKGHTHHYTAYELLSFSYYDDLDTGATLMTYEAVTDPQADGHVFSKLYACGACRVYGCSLAVLRKEGMTGTAVASSLLRTERKYIQVNRSEFYALKPIGFKKIMKEAFASCPTIVARIESKVYTYDNWPTLVKDYNDGICK